MQKTIIATLELFTFDINNMQQQYNLEKDILHSYLIAKYDIKKAGAKYAQITRNIYCYFLQKYNIALQ